MAEDQLCVDRLEFGRRGCPVFAMVQKVGLTMFVMTEDSGKKDGHIDDLP